MRGWTGVGGLEPGVRGVEVKRKIEKIKSLVVGGQEPVVGEAGPRSWRERCLESGGVWTPAVQPLRN